MFKLLVTLCFVLMAYLQATEEEYTFKAKGEFAKELKSLMEKYAKEGKIEIQKVEANQNSNRPYTSIVESILNSDDIAGDIAFGKQLYDKTCFACHGQNAEKNTYPNARILSTLSKEELVKQLEGYSQDPTFGHSTKAVMYMQATGLQSYEIASLAVYIHSIKNGTSPISSSSNDNSSENDNEVKSSYLQ